MGYDIYLKIDTGGYEPATVCEIGNMTSNLSPMWRRALGCSLSHLDLVFCSEAVKILEPAVAHISDPANAREYEAMNPANGWGNHEAATRYLSDLLAGCKEHPKATIHISC
ncbi:hypothetical protein [Bradyrhizobium lablabi]|uniref:hypothetical protein n=1 Tax=Bradyrhizobium lablabi TaxID=722472 RepID=UPI001BAD5B3E|nr:hypothetical protein [Bradyrhizobium lablabi]MBR0693657.1 hypothetical protein [Bradyrhizobium lablabi]